MQFEGPKNVPAAFGSSINSFKLFVEANATRSHCMAKCSKSFRVKGLSGTRTGRYCITRNIDGVYHINNCLRITLICIGRKKWPILSLLGEQTT